jgi:hypothetical protein
MTHGEREDTHNVYGKTLLRVRWRIMEVNSKMNLRVLGYCRGNLIGSNGGILNTGSAIWMAQDFHSTVSRPSLGPALVQRVPGTLFLG